MRHIEPSWGFVDSPEMRTEDTGQLPVELILPIALGSHLRKKWGEIRARSFENKGTVHVNDEAQV